MVNQCMHVGVNYKTSIVGLFLPSIGGVFPAYISRGVYTYMHNIILHVHTCTLFPAILLMPVENIGMGLLVNSILWYTHTLTHTHTHTHTYTPTYTHTHSLAGSRSLVFVCLPMAITWQLERYTLTIHVDRRMSDMDISL